jgi:hypothetical protein
MVKRLRRSGSLSTMIAPPCCAVMRWAMGDEEDGRDAEAGRRGLL